jgi:hypothetical protein
MSGTTATRSCCPARTSDRRRIDIEIPSIHGHGSGFRVKPGARMSTDPDITTTALTSKRTPEHETTSSQDRYDHWCAERNRGRYGELFANEGAVDAQDFSSPASNNITTYRLDVSNEKDWSTVVRDITGQHGRIDVLVNNAGIGGLGQPVTEVTLDDWNRVIAVTQTGVLLGMREVIPHMQQTGGGAIVNISSIWGNTAVPGLAAYHAAKGAVHSDEERGGYLRA